MDAIKIWKTPGDLSVMIELLSKPLLAPHYLTPFIATLLPALLTDRFLPINKHSCEDSQWKVGKVEAGVVES